MYQIIPLIIDEAGQEGRGTDYKLETQWAERIGVVKVVWIWHRY